MEDLLNAVSVPAIAAAVYWVINLLKYTTKCNEKILRFVPLIACGLGVVFTLICYFAIPAIVPTDNLLVAIVIGGASGLTATGFNQIIKQLGADENKGE